MIIITVLYLAERQTRDAIQREVALATSALAVQREELEKVTDDYAYWDDAFVHLSTAPDEAWTDQNISLPVFKKYGYQLTFVVDSAGQQSYAMRYGRRDSDGSHSVPKGVEHLLATVALTASLATTSDLITVDGRPAFAALSKLRPYGTTTPKGIPARYLVFVNILDEPQIARLSQLYLLPNLHFASLESSDGANIVLDTPGMQTPVILAWTGADPGRALVEPLLPILAVLLLGFVGLTVLVLRKALAAAVNLRHAEAKALTDPLTGLPNRTALFRLANELLADRSRTPLCFALLYLDLDGFKSVNDRIGHHAGDLVLRTTTQRILSVLPVAAMLARLGGDEFAIILPGADKPHVIRSVGEKVIKAVQQPIELMGHTVVVGATMGIAIAPVDAVEALELVEKADSALCYAKRVRKGTIHFFKDVYKAQVKLLREGEASR